MATALADRDPRLVLTAGPLLRTAGMVVFALAPHPVILSRMDGDRPGASMIGAPGAR